MIGGWGGQLHAGFTFSVSSISIVQSAQENPDLMNSYHRRPATYDDAQVGASFCWLYSTQ